MVVVYVGCIPVDIVCVRGNLREKNRTDTATLSIETFIKTLRSNLLVTYSCVPYNTAPHVCRLGYQVALRAHYVHQNSLLINLVQYKEI
jgi:hypothetical protein